MAEKKKRNTRQIWIRFKAENNRRELYTPNRLAPTTEDNKKGEKNKPDTID